ncbi:MAG TPA: RNA-binding transcriptional accessory protein [Syntrophomonadaceae bacterium]|nr:RNA-binding transcriptional accessory protein [Syntrophomonadaceae bacterium]
MCIDILKIISDDTGIPYRKVKNTAALLDDAQTVPFIARYRKEMTGELDENQIRKIEELLHHYRRLEQKKEDILRLIDEQGQLSEELKKQIYASRQLTELEDLYRPFRPKRKTRASSARERGLEPLAELLKKSAVQQAPAELAASYVGGEVSDVEMALQGARDIIAEEIADQAQVRQRVRDFIRRHGVLRTRAREEQKDSVYSMYSDYGEKISRIPAHRILAINRGEKEGYLQVQIELDEEPILNLLYLRHVPEGSGAEQVKMAIADGYRRLLFPAVERDLRSELTEKAHEQALQVFSRNLRSLLLQAPVRGKTVVGIDPGYRTGCKWAVVDPTGRMLKTGVFYPTPPQRDITGTQQVLASLYEEYQFDAIVIGNGTGSRETEQVVADFIQQSRAKNLSYTIVSEAGASVYSASPLAAEEFPDLDIAQRSAVSIARRIQDPLAELVKIEPRSIGVGQYQHDIAVSKLDKNLSAVVESAVNYVGVDLNTASSSLLSYVAGINRSVASNLIQYREENGAYASRKQLLDVPKLGPKAFEQAAGFLRIHQGGHPLDATPIHPESYDLTESFLQYIDSNMEEIGSAALSEKLARVNLEQAARDLQAGLPTLRDIAEALRRPGRDPRTEVPPPVFRQDVLNLEDLQVGMVFQGVVRNVVDFGAFVDIGVKQDGLVHISEISRQHIRHPLDVVGIGDIVNVQVIAVDIERKRIALSMKELDQQQRL